MALADYITGLLREPFCWGKLDCCTFANGWVQSQTGKDYLAEFGSWSSALGAARKIRQAGGLEAALDQRFTRVNPKLAKDGDLALYKNSVCIFSGPHIVGPGKNGLEFINRKHAECAWSL